MTTATVSDIQIEALVAWAKVSCRQFMLGVVPEKFWYQYETTGNTRKHSTTTIEGLVYYGANEFVCIIARGKDGVYTWRAYIADPTDRDSVLFHTSDIIKE
jgi:hypothetical protein